MKKLLASGLLLLLLAGCTMAPPRPQPTDTQQAWQQHQRQLAGLHNWRLSGRLGIQTGHEGWHASLDWQQYNGAYTIHITAPLGQGSLQLQGDATSVQLQTSDGDVATAAAVSYTHLTLPTNREV